ncbi:MAG: UDP-N-acetylmuramoyl-L-alanine--D-glutamate ligase, partial [Chitinivibrionales bacterium]|nr:UDP-N-acetylmuramoyl-L-alanine--D-glutamate ligase [Chitinivibrionales bacterium]MBD3355710.1 UDP-N-acetylmuramoyl-L-alanine--D-glutamate ligase [Chitinivibrionales bacterium]
MNNIAETKENSFPRDFMPSRATILGVARSGMAAATFLDNNGCKVFLSDCGDAGKIELMLAANKLAHLPHEAGGHTERALDCDVVILSPGVPSDIPILKQAHQRGIPVWSELELGFRMSCAPWCSITGSTGKSTTTSLLGRIMESANIEHVVAGNIGLPVTRVAPAISAEGWVVAEVSSFQLENIDLFRPRVAAVLNLMKNHLDRYPSENDYYNAKKAIMKNMADNDTIVLNACDPLLAAWSRDIDKRIRITYFGANVAGNESVWVEDNRLMARFGDIRGSIANLSTMKLKGEHNRLNAAAAAAMALAAGIKPEAVGRGLCTFAGLPHRLEWVRTIDSMAFYNDSKATTAESIRCALEAFDANVHLIAGGRDKGCDFEA